MIGKQISPILEEIEGTLLEFEANRGIKPEFTIEGFRAGVKIFMSVMMDKMWELQEKESMDMGVREKMAENLGKEVRALVKTYVDLDTHELYK